MERVALIDLLLDCLHLDPNRVDVTRISGLTGTEWEALVALAEEQRICPLLYQRLKSRGLDAVVPNEIVQSLQDHYRNTAMNNLHLCSELKHIVEALRVDDVSPTDSRVPIIVLKGLHLIAEVYDNIALREMMDLDLLVPKKHLQRVADTLAALGYEPRTPYTIDVDVAVQHHLTAFIKPNGSKVEIHWTITKPHQHYTIAEGELWERAVPIQIAGTDVLGLDPEDLLLHLCIHTSYHHLFAFGLRPSCDIAQVIHHYGEALDWGTVQQRTETRGWGQGVYLALLVAKELVGAAVPGDVLRKLEPPAFEEAIVVTAKNQIFTERKATRSLNPRLAQLMGRNNLWASLRDFAQNIFIPQVALARVYSVSPNPPKIYLYYLVRFKDILVQYGPTAWRLHQNDPEITPLADQIHDLSEWLSDG